MSAPAFEEFPRSSEASRPVRPARKVFDLGMAMEAFPYVKRVLAEIVESSARIAHLELELKRLDLGATTTWQDRKVRFSREDELRSSQAALEALIDELQSAGSVLLNAVQGMAGFPTLVNGSLAYLVASHDADEIAHWRYRDQPRLRPIPAAWRSSASHCEDSEGLLV